MCGELTMTHSPMNAAKSGRRTEAGFIVNLYTLQQDLFPPRAGEYVEEIVVNGFFLK